MALVYMFRDIVLIIFSKSLLAPFLSYLIYILQIFQQIPLLCKKKKTFMKAKEIIESLPYGKGFTFVDKIHSVDEHQIKGSYFFSKASDYYSHHFINQPVTPGVLLLECMGQIGLVSHGIYLLDLYEKSFFPAFSHVEAEFISSLPPDSTAIVMAEKIYCRKNILKSEIKLYHQEKDELIAVSTAICQFIT
jgi:3-hydroxyacyl-[acyl-carrier-protein] dehydratase